MQFLNDTNIDFLGRRKIALAASGIVILVGLASLLIKGGPSLSIDFRGGSIVELRITPAVEIGEIRKILADADLGAQGVHEFGEPEELLIYLPTNRTRGVDDATPTVAAIVAEALPGHVVELRREETVGPKIGGELRTAAINSVFVALLLIIIYISFRFVFHFGVAAVAALVHDVLVTLGLFSLLDKEISLTILAAFLTIIGYSLNDTIVVFDRIRENMGMRRKESYDSVINKSINETLSRTLITSLTTLIVAGILFVAGGAVIHDFAFALVVGVLVGTYSSIFIASPVLSVWHDWRSSDRKRALRPKARRAAA
ncbi:MAG TPA: protein translocase subunit SecF [Candidatus Krumholzibacteria bacterium]|jgi:preprotein translocase subunit SecF